MKKNTIFPLFLISMALTSLKAMETPEAPNSSFVQALGIGTQDIDFSSLVPILPQTVNPALLHLVTVSSDPNEGEKSSPAKYLTQGAHPFESEIPSTTEAHTLNNSDREIKKFECGYLNCSKVFANFASLKEHICAHLELKPYRCPAQNCSQSSAQRTNIKTHMAKFHKDQPELQIPKISKEDKKKIEEAIAIHLPKLAVKQGRLKRQSDDINQSTLDTQNLHKKRLADAAFAVPAAAEDSTNLETPQKKYTCGYPNCSQTSETIKHLKEHICGIHLNLKLYNCPAVNCGQSSAQKCNLRTHIERAHKDQPGLQIPELSKEAQKEMEEKAAPYLPPLSSVYPKHKYEFETELDFNEHNSRLHSTPLETTLTTKWSN
ncbi:hypothetical protein BH09DEP1_BH09DEP1_2170 [soil metagenome]